MHTEKSTDGSGPVLAAVAEVASAGRTVVPLTALSARLGVSAEDATWAAEQAVGAGRLIPWKNDSTGEMGYTLAPFTLDAVPERWQVRDGLVTGKRLEALLMRMEPLSMIEFLEDVLRWDSAFSDVSWADPSGHYDLTGVQRDRRFAFEVKRRRVTTADSVEQAVLSRSFFRKQHINEDPIDFVLVVAGVLSPSARHLAEQHGLTVWDRETLASKSPPHVFASYQAAEARGAFHDDSDENLQTIRRADQLARRLGEIEPGKNAAMKYQNLVLSLVEFLFVPPLSLPEYESRNQDHTQRRDMVCQNVATDGFWALARQMYRADFVVIDAKNYSSGLTKSAVLEVAQYLKWYGPGMFGIIAHRRGMERGGASTLREQWIGSKRMIVAVDDATFLEMLEVRKMGEPPEAIIADCIRKFRLSL